MTKPAYLRPVPESIRLDEYGFLGIPLLGFSVNRGNSPPSSLRTGSLGTDADNRSYNAMVGVCTHAPDRIDLLLESSARTRRTMKRKRAAVAALAGAGTMGIYKLYSHTQRPRSLGKGYSEAPKKVIIVGGGFGGIAALEGLTRALG